MRAQNILHVIESWGPGGAETVCVELAGGLDRSRFAPSSAVIHEGWVYDTLAQRGLEPTIVRTGRGPIDLKFLTGLAALVRRRRIDLIQSHLLGANLYSSMLGLALGIPVFSTFHGTVDLGVRPRWTSLKLRTIAAGSRRMVFVSDALRRSILGPSNEAPARTAVIHNGIDPGSFSPAPTDALRRDLGLARDAIIIGALGNIRPAKGYDVLLEVADALRDDPRLVFVIAGKERKALSSELMARHRELRLGDRVRFLGFRDDIVPLINGMDLYLSTSRTEGFSLTTVQAMACGVPVIATRSGGPEEIVTDGEDGLLVPVGDATAIAAAVRRLANDHDLRARFSVAGRQTVLRRFTLERMVAAYEALYEAERKR